MVEQVPLYRSRSSVLSAVGWCMQRQLIRTVRAFAIAYKEATLFIFVSKV
jgi:hypothetical protein